MLNYKCKMLNCGVASPRIQKKPLDSALHCVPAERQKKTEEKPLGPEQKHILSSNVDTPDGRQGDGMVRHCSSLRYVSRLAV